MKKTFGIYADAYNGKVGQTFAYMQYFSQMGYVRMISTVDNLENIINEVDILVVPGGADVLSSRYNSIPGVLDGRVNQHYEYLDSVLIKQFVDAKKPIVGICRGMQTLNVYFGGTLMQHIDGHNQGENRSKTEQLVYFKEPTIINKNYVNSIEVNSLHHQCVDKLGEGFEIIGSSLHYGPLSLKNVIPIKKSKNVTENYQAVPEIIKHKELPIIAFQYHPEEFDCPYATQEIKKLIELC